MFILHSLLSPSPLSYLNFNVYSAFICMINIWVRWKINWWISQVITQSISWNDIVGENNKNSHKSMWLFDKIILIFLSKGLFPGKKIVFFFTDTFSLDIFGKTTSWINSVCLTVYWKELIVYLLYHQTTNNIKMSIFG